MPNEATIIACRFVERIERSEDNSGALLIEEEAMVLNP